MNEKEFCESVHMEIHAVRRIEGYKANPMERHISKLVIELFKETCKECREVFDKKQKEPEEKKEGFFNKLNNLADNIN